MADMGMATRGEEARKNFLVLFFVGMIDLPCSLIGDTLLLPVTATVEALR